MADKYETWVHDSDGDDDYTPPLWFTLLLAAMFSASFAVGLQALTASVQP